MQAFAALMPFAVNDMIVKLLPRRSRESVLSSASGSSGTTEELTGCRPAIRHSRVTTYPASWRTSRPVSLHQSGSP